MFETKIAMIGWKADQKKFKKFLTNINEYDKLNKLVLNGETKKNLDN